jgi:hypothetical protein
MPPMDVHVMESMLLDHTVRIKDVENKVDNRVTYDQFYWVIGILMTIFIGISGYIVYQIADVQKTAQQTDKNVSSIQGKLEPYNIQFKD